MPLNRRTLLASMASTLALPATRSLGAADPAILEAMPAMARLLPPEYPETPIWSYGGTVPGPVIRARQGAPLARRLVNRLEQPTAVHWHGLRIDNAMDGVPELTQTAVAPGKSFDYAFTPPDAGTFWYHSHNRSWEQMARGLAGALIVEETEGAPEVDHDLVLMIDDWRLTEQGTISDDFGALHDWAHNGRLGNWLTVNGLEEVVQPAAPGARLRLRLVNCANARIFDLSARGLEGWVVALDGMPLEQPQPLAGVTLAPGARADLLVDVVGEAASLDFDGGDQIFPLARFPAEGPAQARRPAPGPLPPNPVPTLGNMGNARGLRLVMEGGAMGGMQGATYQGKRLSPRELAAEGMAWAFNGQAGMPDEPLAEIARGETVAIEIENRSAWPHAMHLHGHHFREIRDSRPGPLRDTILMDGNATTRIAFVADNPGDWLLHCHMLEHAASGMMTWLRVS